MNPTFQDLTTFRSALNEIDWFSQIGKPLAYQHRLSQIDDWPGPEGTTVMPMAEWEQEVYDHLLSTGSPELQATFDEIRQLVHERAAAAVPYNPAGDIWEWANFAVEMASFTSGLMAVHIAANQTPPTDLQTQWDWFRQGRLPCAYAAETTQDQQLFEQFYSEGAPAEGYLRYFEEHPNQFMVY